MNKTETVEWLGKYDHISMWQLEQSIDDMCVSYKFACGVCRNEWYRATYLGDLTDKCWLEDRFEEWSEHHSHEDDTK